jgi:hypothetical protein
LAVVVNPQDIPCGRRIKLVIFEAVDVRDAPLLTLNEQPISQPVMRYPGLAV